MDIVATLYNLFLIVWLVYAIFRALRDLTTPVRSPMWLLRLILTIVVIAVLWLAEQYISPNIHL